MPTARWTAARTRARDVVRAAVRNRRVPGLRTAKLTLAAVLAYLLASWLETSPDRILAPLSALLVVQLTLVQTLSHAVGRVVAVFAGVLLAVVADDIAGLHWWSLGLVVLASLVIGQLLRLRQHLLEVPISAMIVLALGGQAGSAAGRLAETVLGGAVGLAVNLLVAPPLHVRPAEDAVDRLAQRLARAADGLADDLREGWSRRRADAWLDEVRRLTAAVDRADRDLQRVEEGARLNPRGAQARAARPRLRTALTALEHCHVSLRNLCRALLDRTYSLPEDREHEAYEEDLRQALADVLESVADAVRRAGEYSAAAQAPDETLEVLGSGVAELRARRDRLAQLLVVDPVADQGAWEQHGALLAGVDRLRVEVEAAVRREDVSWRPEPMGLRQRSAVRRAVRSPRRPPPQR